MHLSLPLLILISDRYFIQIVARSYGFLLDRVILEAYCHLSTLIRNTRTVWVWVHLVICIMFKCFTWSCSIVVCVKGVLWWMVPIYLHMIPDSWALYFTVVLVLVLTSSRLTSVSTTFLGNQVVLLCLHLDHIFNCLSRCSTICMSVKSHITSISIGDSLSSVTPLSKPLKYLNYECYSFSLHFTSKGIHMIVCIYTLHWILIAFFCWFPPDFPCWQLSAFLYFWEWHILLLDISGTSIFLLNVTTS